MAAIFCCSSITPFRPQHVDHESKFTAFMKWAKDEPSPGSDSSLVPDAPYIIQVVKQVNYGPQDWIRYFVPNDSEFKEATEDALLEANFEKVNSYKNFRCARHNKFFELNLYQKNATNVHHWRANLARPSRDIDLAFRKKEEPTTGSPLITSQEPVPTTATSDITEERPVDHTPPVLPEPGSPGAKLALQLLLPCLQKSLLSNEHYSLDLPRPNSIMLLLALDKVNADMNLGMDTKDLWTTLSENEEHVLTFFWNCIVLDSEKNGASLDISDVQEFLMTTVNDPSVLASPPGRKRLQAIVDKVMTTGRRDGVDWVVRFGHLVEKVMEDGVPSEDVARSLYRGRRPGTQIIVKEWEKENAPGKGHSESTEKEKSVGSDDKNRGAELDNGDEHDDDDDYPSRHDYYDRDYDYDHDYDRYSEKDLTACDQECGYCGHCDY